MQELAIKAIAEPRRREILRLVRERELAAGEIATHFSDVSRPAISQHIGVLKGAGLLMERRLGTRRMYRADEQGLASLRAALAEFCGGSVEPKQADEDQGGGIA